MSSSACHADACGVAFQRDVRSMTQAQQTSSNVSVSRIKEKIQVM